jgi:hypothetical protein
MVYQTFSESGILLRSNAFLFLFGIRNLIGRTADFGLWISVAQWSDKVGEPKIGEHAQRHYFASVTTQTLR